MREIKFRAWDKEEGIMREVSGLTLNPLFTQLKYSSITPTHIDLILNTKRYEGADYERFVPMQYTGLKDKNGKEIYEGDIVQDVANGFEPREFFWVDWVDFRWVLKFKNPFGAWVDERHFKDAFQMKIIGNIYENSELLNSNA